MTFLRFDSAVNSLTSFAVRTLPLSALSAPRLRAVPGGRRKSRQHVLGEGSCFLTKELLNPYVEIFSRGKNFLVQEDRGRGENEV